MHSIHCAVIKIGSNVVTTESGQPDEARMKHLVGQISFLIGKGVKVLLVTSGAVAFGRQEIPLQEKMNPVLKKQIWASVGQIALIRKYKNLFAENGHQVAQILVTKEDFRDRKHYLNMRNCILGLLSQGIVPILNENDTVAITELMFTDNDELASLAAAMVNADTLMLMTNVDGVFDGPPSDPASKLIPKIGHKMPELSSMVSPTKSSFGRGGMLTKLTMARKSADLGIQVIIANGKKDHILKGILEDKIPYSYFEPKSSKQSQKKWLAHGEQYYKGEVVINEGAKSALSSEKIVSLLPIGIVSTSGDFSKGDIIRIIDEKGEKIGLGKSEYNSSSAKQVLGQKNQKPFIHYDYLYLFQHD
ncbi:glutamate 5-kinase [Aquiflexum sp.]|uniref:glutamate 5-kinase n=1 Tax=Aquiflexum sp. TaxID=1872584 RepID=UPI003594619C